MPKTIVADKYKFVAGVDTHAKTHHLTLIDNLGKILGKREIKVNPTSMAKAITWVVQKTNSKHPSEEILFAIEGTSSYGETFTIALKRSCMNVCEVKPPKIKTRGQNGKTDELDSLYAARGVLTTVVENLIDPKAQGQRKALRILLQVRRHLTRGHNMDNNALIALLRTNDLAIDTRYGLTMPIIKVLSAWLDQATWLGQDQQQTSNLGDPTIGLVTARVEARRLATNILRLRGEIKQNTTDLKQGIIMVAPSLLTSVGFGPVAAAQILCSYSHKGRIKNEASFASLAGTSPLPASSGKIVRHRLSRFGDRSLNCALHQVVLTRMRCHQQTKDYVQRQTLKGKSRKEIIRKLKRYLARSVFKQLQALNLKP
jgi:transposase